MTYNNEYNNLINSYKNFRDEKHDTLASMFQTSFLIGQLHSWMIVAGEEFVI